MGPQPAGRPLLQRRHGGLVEKAFGLTLREAIYDFGNRHAPCSPTFARKQAKLGINIVGFLTAVGSDPAQFPPEFLGSAAPLVPVLRRGRPLWYPELPLGELADIQRQGQIHRLTHGDIALLGAAGVDERGGLACESVH